MEPTQLAFGLYSIFVAVVIGLVYWVEDSLIGVYIGWLLATLAGIWLPQVFVGVAVSLL